MPGLLVAEQAMIGFLSNFFQNFISSLGVEPDGTGLSNLIREPYGQPASVPEPSSGFALLMFATVSCVGAMLKSHWKSANRSRTVIQ